MKLFLPGIMINGHSWRLVLTTYQDGKLNMGTIKPLESTETVLETFQILAGLEELIGWASNVYKKWY